MISILLYHQIAQVPAQQDPGGSAIPHKLFEQQMTYLYQAGYGCLGLGEAVDYMQKGSKPPRKSFVLTFDDGYQNLYSSMWPILNRFGFTATIFLVTGRIGHESDWGGQNGACAVPLLSWDEIGKLARAGLTFGSHTLSHPRLTHLDDAHAVRELEDSKATIEDHLGTRIDLFAYPYGNLDTRIQRLVAESGYKAACGIDRGAWGFYNLWRVGCVSTDSMRLFALKVDGWDYRRIWLREQSPFGRPLKQVFKYIRRIVTLRRTVL